MLIVLTGVTTLYFWVGGLPAPSRPENTLDIDVHVINSSALSVVNMDVEDSRALDVLSTSVGNCSFSSSTILQPGLREVCTFSSSVPSGTVIMVYGQGLTQTTVTF